MKDKRAQRAFGGSCLDHDEKEKTRGEGRKNGSAEKCIIAI